MPNPRRSERPHHGMLRLVEMLGRHVVLRRIAAAHVPAHQAQPQVHPVVSHLEALLASLVRGLASFNLMDIVSIPS